MVPLFILPAGYEPRELYLMLGPGGLARRHSGKWEFRGVTDGTPNLYSVPARGLSGGELIFWPTFKTRKAAREWAAQRKVPPFGEWVPQARRYKQPDGGAWHTRALPRDVAQ